MPKDEPVAPAKPYSGMGERDDARAAKQTNPETSTNYVAPNRVRPGLGTGAGDTAQLYDKWWNKSSSKVLEFADMYEPKDRNTIIKFAWIYRRDQTLDGLYDALTQNGIVLGDGDGSSSGSRGGGGGGGSGADKTNAYASARAAIVNESRRLGIDWAPNDYDSIAKTVVDQNWSNEQLLDYLVPAAQKAFDENRPGTELGIIAKTVQDIKKTAAAQLLTVSDATAREWASKVASNEMEPEAVKTLLAQQAKLRYGWAAASIDAGMNVRDVVLPSRDRIAQELELNPEDLDLTDSKWLGMIQTVDEKTGQPRIATDSEVVMRARKDSRWAQTRNATRVSADMAMMVRNIFEG